MWSASHISSFQLNFKVRKDGKLHELIVQKPCGIVRAGANFSKSRLEFMIVVPSPSSLHWESLIGQLLHGNFLLLPVFNTSIVDQKMNADGRHHLESLEIIVEVRSAIAT
jgi:hypothetical protein